VASNGNCFIKTEGLFKVIGSHVQCESDISWKRCKMETLLLQITKRTDTWPNE